ncbi:MAG: uroporphyrinogen decarboxylase family protein [Thermoguttaceae bacterium]
MNDPQWETLLRLVRGEWFAAPPVALLVDGPWISSWYGVPLVDYYASDRVWLDANLAVVEAFPDALLLAGFWGEFGMSTNPSAFGCRLIWPEDGFPTVDRRLDGHAAIDGLKKPNCRTDGLHPFVLKRLHHAQAEMERIGHRVRLATTHGPITTACYLLGHTELLLGMKTDPASIHRLLDLVTEFAVDWLVCQKAEFPTIEGVIVLEDLMGFLGEADFAEFAQPCVSALFAALDVPVRLLHNDAFGLITARHLAEMGVNLFNFSFEQGVERIRALADPGVALMGNVPPRDVLARGTCDDVRRSVAGIVRSVDPHRRLLVSAGGFVPPGTTAEKIETLCRAAREAVGPDIEG